jgi:voltage-dependent potassium channel beta subunit
MQGKTPMEYRKLGGTGISVSVIGFGPQTYSFGAVVPPTLEQLTYETLKRALELGVNYIDNAEFYGAGLLETYIGNSLKKLNVNREDIVVSTKIYFGSIGGPNSVGCSRKRLIEGLKNSLKRLQLDYVDIVFASRYDSGTSLEELCRAMDHLIRTERALYWGTSEWSSVQITQAIELCERLNLYKPVVEQPQYNMINRQRFEGEYAELFENYKLGATVWSPLAAGILTGKYLDDPNAGRVTTQRVKDLYGFDQWFGPEKVDKTRAMFKEFEEIAKSLGGTIPQLALAWVLRNKDVSTMICGFTKVEQVDENLKAIEMAKKFTLEIEERIEKLLANKPKTPMDWRKHAPKPSRR